MTDHSNSNEKKEPPKITLGIPEMETGSAADKKPEVEPKQSAPEQPAEAPKKEVPQKPVPIKLTGGVPEASAPHESPPAEAKNKQPTAAPKAKPPQHVNGNGPESDHQAESDTGDPSKDKTIRLDNIEEESLEYLYQSALNATQRVILDEQQKKKETAPQKGVNETQALEQAEMAEATKKSTARLDLQEMLSDEDQKELLKQQTMHISADGSSQTRPSGAMKVQKPDDEPERKSSATIPIPTDFDGGKSETAHNDLPREVTSTTPPTQRKTIRIKRPDAGGLSVTRPALTVARPSTKKARPTEATDETGGGLQLDSEESAHPVFAAIALIAVLVGLVLVYVLAATLNPGVPFPGRLV